MPVRLLTADEVVAWRARLSTGMAAAVAAQRSTVAAALRLTGQTWDTPAPASTLQWDQDAWTDALETHLRPAALAVARDQIEALRGRLSARATRGALPDPATLAALAVDRAAAGGPWVGSHVGLSAAGANPGAIGRALDDAAKAMDPNTGQYGGIIHPDAALSIGDEFQRNLANLSDLAANSAGPMANMAVANLAEATAQAQGVTLTWRSAMLPTTREAHADADGQVVNAGETFDVGGEDLAFPGDPNGSDENTINCLCWTEADGLEGSDGG